MPDPVAQPEPERDADTAEQPTHDAGVGGLGQGPTCRGVRRTAGPPTGHDPKGECQVLGWAERPTSAESAHDGTRGAGIVEVEARSGAAGGCLVQHRLDT